MKNMTGSDALLQCLTNEGIDTVFGYPGGTIMPLYDKLYSYTDKLRHILTRHEQGAVHAAQGYARATGKVGVCMATSGPGATNLVTGIADAMIDSTPIVAITAQVVARSLGTDEFQEVDIIGVTMPITKWNYQITSADEIPEIIAKAFYLARTGRPGPVLIDITKDALVTEIANFTYKPCEYVRGYYPYPKLNQTEIDEAIKLIDNAKQPIIFAGHGVELSQAQDELIALSEKANIPIASTIMSLNTINYDHPNFVGMLGMHGNYAPNIKTNEADVIIGVGLRFDSRVTGNLAKFAKQAKIIHIEIDRAEIGKILQPTLAVNCDAKTALKALADGVKPANHQAWIDSFKPLDKIEHDEVIENAIHPKSGDIKMGEVVNLISEKTKGTAIVVTDVGQNQMATCRYYKFRQGSKILTSGGLGTMGYGIPAGVGAKVARPEKQVITFVGDGGFQMTAQELGTMAANNIGLKIVLLNNTYLGNVRQWQERFFGHRYSFVDIAGPDYITIAKGWQVDGQRVVDRKDLSAAIDAMLADDRPYVLEVAIEPEEGILPMVEPGDGVSDMKLK
ncbi:MAG: biosynthetic-type acetolactate synthase large subunit [Bacteroidales bacterium]|nr:biosynthetic-type acetolactate synthase large subunit [Bacteroidales bacterium]MBR4116341.1 biosynthetic-type acetolactate synthase large subunit [Bacteroidales bacterium]